MESENKPPLIWPSRTPKSIPKKNFGPKSFPSKQVLAHFSSRFEAFCKNCAQYLQKHIESHTCWWEQKGKTWDQNSVWELIQESQRAKLAGVYFQIQFDPSVIGATVYLLNRVHTDQYPVYFFSTRFKLYTEQGAGSLTQSSSRACRCTGRWGR